jgi:hypothetical protein
VITPITRNCHFGNEFVRLDGISICDWSFCFPAKAAASSELTSRQFCRSVEPRGPGTAAAIGHQASHSLGLRIGAAFAPVIRSSSAAVVRNTWLGEPAAAHIGSTASRSSSSSTSGGAR